jgi:hypothetical protein
MGPVTSRSPRRPATRTVALTGAAVAGAHVGAAAAAPRDTAPGSRAPPRPGGPHPAPARAVSPAVPTRLRFWAARIALAGSRSAVPALARTRVPHTRPDRSDRGSHRPCSAAAPVHTGRPEIAGRALGPGRPGAATVFEWVGGRVAGPASAESPSAPPAHATLPVRDRAWSRRPQSPAGFRWATPGPGTSGRRPDRAPAQSASEHPLHWCGVKPTLSG